MSGDGVRPVAPGRCYACGRQYVPDVRGAPWVHPYRFSGRVPPRTIALMVGAAAATAVVVGVVAFLGGGFARALAIGATDLATDLAAILGESSLIGTGVAVAIAITPMVVIGVGYAAIMGGLAGSAVAWAVRRGGCRQPRLIRPMGYLAGAGTYVVFLATTAAMDAPFHESSRVLEVLDPPWSYLLMVIDASIVIYTAVITAGAARALPFCEACGSWYQEPRTASIPIAAAPSLVEALASGSAAPMRGVPANVGDDARIELELSHCGCGVSEYELIATVRWDVLRKRKRGMGERTERWFETTLPATLGAELEASWSPTPPPKPMPEPLAPAA